MKYKQLISFNPITTVIQPTDANNVTEEEKLVAEREIKEQFDYLCGEILKLTQTVY